MAFVGLWVVLPVSPIFFAFVDGQNRLNGQMDLGVFRLYFGLGLQLGLQLDLHKTKSWAYTFNKF